MESVTPEPITQWLPETSEAPDIRLLAPFPPHAVPRVWTWCQPVKARVFDDFAPRTVNDFVAQWLAAEERGRLSWAVLRDDELGGVITSQLLSPVVADLHCVFKREFWGHKITVPALRMALDAIFQTGIRKISTGAFSDNRALLGMICAVGGKREGLLAGHTLRGGEPLDVVSIGVQREDFYASGSTYTSNYHRDRSPDGRAVEPGREQDQHAERDQLDHSYPDALPAEFAAIVVQSHQ